MDMMERIEAKAKELQEKLKDAYANREELLAKAKKELEEEFEEFSADMKQELGEAKVRAADLFEQGKAKLDEAIEDFRKQPPGPPSAPA